MTNASAPSLGSSAVDSQPGAPDPGPPDGNEDDDPRFPWLPPEDRLWRHPSEAQRDPTVPTFTDPASFAGLIGDSAATRRGAGWGRTATVALVAGFVGALAASGVGIAGGWWNHQTTIVRSTTPNSPTVSLADAGGSTNWAAVEESVAASVVGVAVEGPAGPQQGSGLVMVATDQNTAFVVTDRSLFLPDQSAGYKGSVTVTFLSGDTVRAKLLGTDGLTGLALLQVSDPAKDIPAAIGSVADTRDADPVLAVGARTLAGGSLSAGSISGEDRTVDLTDGTDMDSLIAVTMPAMTPEATGGPLLDQYGRVVGLTISVDPTDQTEQQVTFAVPIDEVNRVATELINRDRVSHPWLGVSNSEDVPSVMAHQLGLTGGVVAGQVTPGSPAGAAGLEDHDIITGFNGKPMTSTGSLVAALVKLNPGARVPMTYIHSGRTVSTTVVLSDQPADGS